MLAAGKARPESHWKRQIAKYKRKLEAAQNPTQRNYAQQALRAAQQSLNASRGGAYIIEEEDVVDLSRSDYVELRN